MSPVKKNPFIRYVQKRRKEEEAASGEKYTLQQAVELFGPEWRNMDKGMLTSVITKTGRSVEAEATKNTSLVTEDDFNYGMKGRGTVSAEDIQKKRYSSFNGIEPEDLRATFDNAWLKTKNSFGQTMEDVYSKQLNKVKVQKWQKDQISRLLNEAFGNPLTIRFVLIHFSLYVVSDSHDYIPAEFAMASFSLEDGLLDNFCTLIDPGTPPLGYLNDFRSNCEKLGNPNPPFDKKCQNYKQIWENMVIFLNRYKTHNTDTTFLFCHPSELENTYGCLEWLSKKTGYPVEWDLLPYSTLLYQMTRYGREKNIEWLERQRKLECKVTEQELEAIRQSSESQMTSSSIDDEENDANSDAEPSNRISSTSDMNLNWEENKINFEPIDTCNKPSVYGSMRSLRIRKIDGDRPGHSSKQEDLDTCTSMPRRTSIYEPTTRISGNYRDREVFLMEKQAEDFLDSLDLAFMPELACPHHMANTYGVQFCPLNIVNRFIFNTIDIVIGFFHIAPKEGTHYPYEDLMDERRKRRMQVQFYTHCTYTDLQNLKGSMFFKS